MREAELPSAKEDGIGLVSADTGDLLISYGGVWQRFVGGPL